MNEHQRQALLRRTRTLLTELGYDLTAVTDSHLEHCITGFLAALEGFGAREREGEAGAAGVKSTSLKELLDEKPKGTV